MFTQTVSILPRAKDPVEIVVIRFRILMVRCPVVSRRKGMNDSSLESRFTKGSHHHELVNPRHLDTDDRVLEVVFVDNEFDCLNRLSEIALSTFDHGIVDENLASNTTSFHAKSFVSAWTAFVGGVGNSLTTDLRQFLQVAAR